MQADSYWPMSNARFFVGKADYKFGSKYILLHVASGECLNFSRVETLHSYLTENYGNGYKKKLSYMLPDNENIERLRKMRWEQGLEEITYSVLNKDEIKALERKLH